MLHPVWIWIMVLIIGIIAVAIFCVILRAGGATGPTGAASDALWLVLHFGAFVLVANVIPNTDWWHGVIAIFVWEAIERILAWPLPQWFDESSAKCLWDVLVSSAGFILGFWIRGWPRCGSSGQSCCPTPGSVAAGCAPAIVMTVDEAGAYRRAGAMTVADAVPLAG